MEAENCPCRLCKTYVNKRKAWNIQVVYLELWFLLASIILLPINTDLFVLPF